MPDTGICADTSWRLLGATSEATLRTAVPAIDIAKTVEILVEHAQQEKEPKKISDLRLQKVVVGEGFEPS